MKKILSLFAAALIIAGCNKDKTSLPVTPTEKKLREFVNVSAPSDNRSYIYDGGRLVKMTTPGRYIIFEYPPSKFVAKEYDSDTNALIGSSESQLDASGKATVKKRYTSSGELQHTMFFTYDAAGYLINVKTEYANGLITEAQYGISGGNVVSEDYYVNGTLDDKTDYFYDAARISKINFSMETNHEIKGLQGTSCKNELIGYKRYNGTSGQLEGHAIHTYQYDSDGYPTEKITTNQLTGVSYKYQYVYK